MAMMITLAGAVLAVAALLGPADAPGPDEDEAFVAADVDGDGVADPVTLRRIGPATQLLRVALADEIRDAVVPVDDLGGPALPLAEPRPADLDGDGRAELLLVTAVGANTTAYQVWRFTDDRGLHAVTDEHGEPWRLHEGGASRRSPATAAPATRTAARTSSTRGGTSHRRSPSRSATTARS
ncbi:hypothetical protein BJF78_18230 [Pseudonocardia sp. CNS-139]|nr:hypothetical protein BJF78_18230 [Pseudonocardia sp. CNS-139]